MTTKIAWKCPDCGAPAHEHGKGGNSACADRHHSSDRHCDGLICECDDYDNLATHGVSLADPCPNARCYHCSWVGQFPQAKGKVLPWQKKALDAGWTPPKGWGT